MTMSTATLVYTLLLRNHCYFCFKPHGTLRGRNTHMAKVHPRKWRAMRKSVGKIPKGTWSDWVEIPR